MANAQALLEKIEALPAARIAEIEDFVDFLTKRERDDTMRSAFTGRSHAAFARVWDNSPNVVAMAITSQSREQSTWGTFPSPSGEQPGWPNRLPSNRSSQASNSNW